MTDAQPHDLRLRRIKAVITIAIRLRYDYDTTTTYRARLLPFDAIRREQKINVSVFRRSRVVVVSYSNRNCDISLSRTLLELIHSLMISRQLLD